MKIIDPAETIYSLKMSSVIEALEHRLGDEAQELSIESLYLARSEVAAVFDHYFDPRDYIDMGLDAWEITRNL